MDISLTLEDTNQNRGELTVRVPDGTNANSALASVITQVEVLSDATIVDFGVTENIDLDMPIGLKAAPEEDAHPNSNARIKLENTDGVATYISIPVMVEPDYQALIDSVPAIITNPRNETLTPISAKWTNK